MPSRLHEWTQYCYSKIYTDFIRADYSEQQVGQFIYLVGEMFFYKGFTVFAYHISYCSKRLGNFFRCARCFGGIGKVMVKGSCVTGKNGTLFFGMVANRYHEIEGNAQVFVDVVGGMLRYINPIRLHGGDGFGVYAMGFNAGAIYFGPVAGKML